MPTACKAILASDSIPASSIAEILSSLELLHRQKPASKDVIPLSKFFLATKLKRLLKRRLLGLRLCLLANTSLTGANKNRIGPILPVSMTVCMQNMPWFRHFRIFIWNKTAGPVQQPVASVAALPPDKQSLTRIQQVQHPISKLSIDKRLQTKRAISRPLMNYYEETKFSTS